MSNKMTLEQLEQQVAQLPPHEQLKLVAHISEQLINLALVATTQENNKEGAKSRLAKVDAWLAECDKVAELWEEEFDSATDLRRIRDEGESVPERCIDAK